MSIVLICLIVWIGLCFGCLLTADKKYNKTHARQSELLRYWSRGRGHPWWRIPPGLHPAIAFCWRRGNHSNCSFAGCAFLCRGFASW